MSFRRKASAFAEAFWGSSDQDLWLLLYSHSGLAPWVFDYGKIPSQNEMMVPKLTDLVCSAICHHVMPCGSAVRQS